MHEECWPVVEDECVCVFVFVCYIYRLNLWLHVIVSAWDVACIAISVRLLISKVIIIIEITMTYRRGLVKKKISRQAHLKA